MVNIFHQVIYGINLNSVGKRLNCHVANRMYPRTRLDPYSYPGHPNHLEGTSCNSDGVYIDLCQEILIIAF